MLSQDLRSILKLCLAALLAGTFSLATTDINYVWYPLLAVVLCMDDTDAQVLNNIKGRVLGTVLGGVVSGFVHTVSHGWWGLTISMLVLIPLLRLLNWQAGLSSAVVVCSMLFLVEDYSLMGWGYVFARTLDTLVGVLAVVIVSILFWRIDRPRNLLDQEKNLKDLLFNRLEQTKQWLTTSNNIELDFMPLKCSQLCRKFTAMAGEELRAHPKSHRRHWRQRALLWDQLNHHSMQLIQLAAQMPAGCLVGQNWLSSNAVNREQLRQLGYELATKHTLAPLLILALQDEYKRVICTIHSLKLACRADTIWY